jgi:hypothetical protein
LTLRASPGYHKVTRGVVGVFCAEFFGAAVDLDSTRSTIPKEGDR